MKYGTSLLVHFADRVRERASHPRAPFTLHYIAMALTCASLLSVHAAGCKGRGCSNDKDCKGDRVCDKGECVEAKAAPGEPPAVVAPTPVLAEVPQAPTHASASCLACSTQEDFDAAMKKGGKCCPVTTCRGDSECAGGRVCCRIPSGQLCADLARCSTINRVAPGTGTTKAPKPTDRAAACRDSCPGGEVSHCYCACMGDCTD